MYSFFVDYYQLQIRTLAVKLAVRSIDLNIYDLAANLAAMILNAAQLLYITSLLSLGFQLCYCHDQLFI